ncbi:hypothetical protein [Salidesulfovibrio onnuriiensis]|uniref:hypothetical protein n=1 Tax=Salidesulfovibrio onnuriiensis TaxID=2583823 RepID=UPI0011C8B52C|nr:hypothetical protein [Salidesulfovibrio onnuriiensis]
MPPTIMPQSELTRKAVKWICEMQEDPSVDKPLQQLLELAGMQFNLSPRDMEFLERFFKQNKKA